MVLLKLSNGKKSRGLRVKSIATVLIGLKSTSHFLAQAEISTRSWFIIPSISRRFVAEKNNELSSANSLTKLKRFSAISFTYTKKSSGPRTEP